MVDELIVAGSISVLNEIVIALLRATLVALLSGLVSDIVGVGLGDESSSFEHPEINKMKTIEKSDKS